MKKEGAWEVKKSRYTEEQVIGAMKPLESRLKVKELAREVGVNEETSSTSILPLVMKFHLC
jgi:hypothetical protein